MAMTIFDHWTFRISGTFEEFLQWQDNQSAATIYGLRLDFFGGKQTVQLSADEFHKLKATLKPGLQGRISGDILQSNGKPRLRIAGFEFEGITPSFKPLSVEERVGGGMFQGAAELVRNYSGSRKDGSPFGGVILRTYGGEVDLSISNRLAEIPESGYVLVTGRVYSQLVRVLESGRWVTRTELRYELLSAPSCDIHGNVVQSGKAAAKEKAA